jgi:DNA repair protein SbcD/Mre11
MKILHTSDWHLGKILHEHSLIDDQIYILNKLVEFIKENPHDVLIIAGDIYDRSVPPKEAMTAFSGFISNLRKVSDIPLVLIPGNHDSSHRLSYLSEIIALSGIYIRTDPDDSLKPIRIGDADIYAVPYLDPYTFDVHDDSEQRQERSHENALRTAVNAIESVMDNKRLNIFAGHLFTRGGSVSGSERKFVGTSGEVDAGILKNFDYCALGHLHRPQKAGERVRYSGSLMKYSFSEADDQKRILSIHLEKEKCEVNDIILEPLRELSRISGLLGDIINENKYKIYKDHYLEIELEDTLLLLNPLQELSKYFSSILSLRRKETGFSSTETEVKRGEGMDISDDFESFQKFIHDENNVSLKEKRKLFNEYLKKQPEMEN